MLTWTVHLLAGGQWLPELKHLAGGADDWQLPGDKPRRVDWDEVSTIYRLPLVLLPRLLASCYSA